jgi:hypothetical protein
MAREDEGPLSMDRENAEIVISIGSLNMKS